MRILTLSMLSVFLVAGSAMAYPYLEVTGLVDPGTAITDNNDGTSTLLGVEYTFYVDTADLGAEMNSLNLEFGSDVFTSVSGLIFVNPTDWSDSLLISSSGSIYEITSAGTFIGVGESLQFTVNITMNNAAFTDSSLWNEGQVWGQSFTAGDTLNGSDGGSTAPVPEPATVMLVGTGLLGMIAFGRKRFIKKI